MAWHHANRLNACLLGGVGGVGLGLGGTGGHASALECARWWGHRRRHVLNRTEKVGRKEAPNITLWYMHMAYFIAYYVSQGVFHVFRNELLVSPCPVSPCFLTVTA